MRPGPALAVLLALAAAPLHANEAQRVVSVGGTLTEIVFALGEGGRLVARDTTSGWPPEAEALPDVGYMRALSAEGVLSVTPGLILAEEGAGPPEALDLLRAASVPMALIPEPHDIAGIPQRIEAVADALGVPEKGAALAAEVAAQLAAAETAAADRPSRKRVLFVLSAQGGRILASGGGTSADLILGLAGAENAVTGFEGYKPMTDEAVAAAAPDVILMMDRGGDFAITDEALLALPALVTTPAAANHAVVRMNGLLLLGLGPRTAQAATELAAALYGEAG